MGDEVPGEGGELEDDEEAISGDLKGLFCDTRSMEVSGGTLTFSICSFCLEESGASNCEQEGQSHIFSHRL